MAKTSLSVAAEVVYGVLSKDDGVKSKSNKVFYMGSDKAELPYVAFRRSGFSQNPVKAGHPGADTVRMSVNCYAATGAGSLELAEVVRAALDNKGFELDGMTMRSCTLVEAEEFWEADAFTQALTFEIRI